MDNLTIAGRNHTNRKGNKENTQPAQVTKSFIKRDKVFAPPFQLKGNQKEGIVAKDESLKAKAKQVDTRPLSGEALKKGRSVQTDVRAAAASRVIRRTHSQVFLTEQAVKHKKMVAEAPNRPAAVVPSKAAPGMYKGKIIQSKIGSIWKTNNIVGAAEPKPVAPKTESQRVGNVAKRNISKSVAELPGGGIQKPVLARCKSVPHRPARVVSKPAASSRQPAGFCSARPPARTASASLTTKSSRNATVAGNQNAKPKVPVAEKKVNKPAVSSCLSQYRFSVETAEERRAKLAEWLASKGKTLKRPAMATAAPSKVSAKEDDVKPQALAEFKQEPDASSEARTLDSAPPAAQEAELSSQTPEIMNTTLELLDSSDSGVDDIVVNLCDALEAMMTPSKSSDDEPEQVADECDVDPKDEDVSQQLKFEQVKDESEDSNAEEVDDDDDVVDCDEDVTEMPQKNDASVIKYSVKTTPYLQSVKRTIEGETCASSARKRSGIKDLKFLTPVRRSCRIQRKSSCLPTMLVDHDPCVSSLAELVRLDDDPNAYIYRKNPALLEDLPDQNGL
ncbi:cytoskeleton-associated protein 2 [Menidia menidia]